MSGERWLSFLLTFVNVDDRTGCCFFMPGFSLYVCSFLYKYLWWRQELVNVKLLLAFSLLLAGFIVTVIALQAKVTSDYMVEKPLDKRLLETLKKTITGQTFVVELWRRWVYGWIGWGKKYKSRLWLLFFSILVTTVWHQTKHHFSAIFTCLPSGHEQKSSFFTRKRCCDFFCKNTFKFHYLSFFQFWSFMSVHVLSFSS